MCQSPLVLLKSTALLRPVAALLVGFLLFLSVTTVGAQSVSIEGGVNISYPPTGSVLGNNDIIYFNPGEINIHEWRITIGSSPDTSGLFDSGVYKFSEAEWELAIDGLPNDGKPVTMRFWQRDNGGAWISSDYVYNTQSGGQGSGQGNGNNTGAAPKAPEVTISEKYTLCNCSAHCN